VWNPFVLSKDAATVPFGGELPQLALMAEPLRKSVLTAPIPSDCNSMLCIPYRTWVPCIANIPLFGAIGSLFLLVAFDTPCIHTYQHVTSYILRSRLYYCDSADQRIFRMASKQYYLFIMFSVMIKESVGLY
jgi:hypothetical protein